MLLVCTTVAGYRQFPGQDFIADFEVCDVRSDGFNDSSTFDAENVGPGLDVHTKVALKRVETIDSNGALANEDLVGLDAVLGDLSDLEGATLLEEKELRSSVGGCRHFGSR